jgi:hypothetical protein
MSRPVGERRVARLAMDPIAGITGGMETSESDIGYPEEQPPEVDDTPGSDERRQGPSEGGRHGEGSGPETDNDDGTATGNPASAG